jgi:multicomponent Na+:H+ antiporter subunit D
VPFFMFFGHDSGLRPKEAPAHMHIAMGIAAFLCIYLAVDFKTLYSLLPYAVDYVPYTGAHVVGQLQLLMFGALAFCLLILSGIYPAEIRAEHLDTDWFYRKGGHLFYCLASRSLNGLNSWCNYIFNEKFTAGLAKFAENAPIILIVTLLTPIIRRKNMGVDNKKQINGKIRAAIITASIPIGISAAVAALFFIALFFFM